MKSLKANNYDKAIKEIDKLEVKGLSGEIESNIRPEDAKVYHVGLIRITPVAGSPKNDVSVQVQHYSPLAFQKLEKNFQFHGIDQLVIVHDPTKATAEAETGKTVAPQTTTPLKTQAEIDAEIEEKVKAGVAEALASQGSTDRSANVLKSVKEDGEEEEEFETELDIFLKDASLEKLKTFAKENNVDITGFTKDKEKITLAIIDWNTKQEEQKA